MWKGVLLMIKIETGMEVTVDGNFYNNPSGNGKDRKAVILLNVRQRGDQVKADVQLGNGSPITTIEGSTSSDQFTATLGKGGTVPVKINPI